MLTNLGCKVDNAVNGKIAAEKVLQNQYDLVFMDLQMPVMGGVEATQKIRAAGKKDLAIIALTAAAMREDEQKSIEAGMNDYITKPVQVDKLKEKISKWAKV